MSAHITTVCGNLSLTPDLHAPQGCRSPAGNRAPPRPHLREQFHDHCHSTVPTLPELLIKGFPPPSLDFSLGDILLTFTEPCGLGVWTSALFS